MFLPHPHFKIHHLVCPRQECGRLGKRGSPLSYITSRVTLWMLKQYCHVWNDLSRSEQSPVINVTCLEILAVLGEKEAGLANTLLPAFDSATATTTFLTAF